MKMFLTLLLAGIMVLSVTFSGCGSTNDDTSAQKTEKNQKMGQERKIIRLSKRLFACDN